MHGTRKGLALGQKVDGNSDVFAMGSSDSLSCSAMERPYSIHESDERPWCSFLQSRGDCGYFLPNHKCEHSKQVQSGWVNPHSWAWSKHSKFAFAQIPSFIYGILFALGPGQQGFTEMQILLRLAKELHNLGKTNKLQQLACKKKLIALNISPENPETTLHMGSFPWILHFDPQPSKIIQAFLSISDVWDHCNPGLLGLLLYRFVAAARTPSPWALKGTDGTDGPSVDAVRRLDVLMHLFSEQQWFTIYNLYNNVYIYIYIIIIMVINQSCIFV